MIKNNKKQDLVAIQKTAATIVDIADNSDVPYSLLIKELLKKKLGEIQSFAPTMSAIVVSRYLTNHKMLEEVASLTKGKFQVIELGSGFTPHALNLGNNVFRYIEIDLPKNIKIKKELIKEIKHEDSTVYISGSVLDQKTWWKVCEFIDDSLPVVVFSEGFLIYFSKEEQDKLLLYISPIIKSDGVSRFVFDDSMKYHPELQTHSTISQGKKDVISSSKNKNFDEVLSQEVILNNFKERGFSKIQRIPYVYSGKLKEIIDKYKLFECFK